MSRAKGRAGVWIYTALLAGALTQAVADKAMAQRPGNTAGTPSTKVDGPAGKLATDKTSAKSKLLRARTELAQGNIDGAESLAREVAGMSLTWSSSEDSPKQVLTVIGKAKTQPRTLLQASRYALTRKDYASAEKYARMAEDNSSLVSFTPWGDSPRKVMEEIRKAKGTGTPTGVAAKKGTPGEKVAMPASNGMKAPYVESPAMPPAVSTKNTELVGAAKDKTPVARQTMTGPTMPSALAKTTPAPADAGKEKSPVVGRTMMPTKTASTTTSETDEARQLVQKARKAMAEKKYDEARTCVASARTKKANLSWWEDNPEKVEMDLKKLEGSTNTAVANAKTTNGTNTKTTNMADAKKPTSSEIVPVSATVVKAGEDKTKTAQPTTLPRTKDEARMQLMQGRKLLAEGKIEDAARVSQKVKSQPTISWGLFEDSPDRLSMDIEKARARRDRDESARLVVEGRKLYEKGDLEGATRLAYRAQKMHGSYSIWDLGDRPSKLLLDIQSAQARSRKTALPPTAVARKDDKPATPEKANDKTMPKKADTLVAKSGDSQDPLPPVPGVGTGSAKPMNSAATTPATPVVSGDRLRAQQLVAEAQRLHREGKLLEARMKT
ncbi:MAG: hypothetical protein ACKO23_09670, partial [Gemmataceae bacterium]